MTRGDDGGFLNGILRSITGSTKADKWIAMWRDPRGALPSERDAYLCARLAAFLGNPPNPTQLRLTIADLRNTASVAIVRDAYLHVVGVRQGFAPSWGPAPTWQQVSTGSDASDADRNRTARRPTPHDAGQEGKQRVTASTFVADNSGRRVVRSIYQRLQIDDVWSVWDEDGFTWWGHRCAQRIRTDAGRESHGLRVYRVTATVDWIDIDPALSFPIRLSPLLSGAILSGYSRDPVSGRVSARLSANVHQQSEKWLGELLSHAALLQLWEIEGIGAMIARAEGLDVPRSAHPVSGPRERRDDVMAAVEKLMVPAGRHASIWARNPSEFAQTASVLKSAPLFTARQGLTRTTAVGLTAEVGVGTRPGPESMGGQSALISADTSTAHPLLGNGVQVITSMPVMAPKLNPVDICLQLGYLEHETMAEPHGLGTWCIDPFNGCLCHVLFVPNLLYQPGILMHLVMNAGLRAVWADEVLKKPTQLTAACSWR